MVSAYSICASYMNWCTVIIVNFVVLILILYKHINQINVTYLNLVHVEACGSFIARRRELFHRDIGFE